MILSYDNDLTMSSGHSAVMLALIPFRWNCSRSGPWWPQWQELSMSSEEQVPGDLLPGTKVAIAWCQWLPPFLLTPAFRVWQGHSDPSYVNILSFFFLTLWCYCRFLLSPWALSGLFWFMNTIYVKYMYMKNGCIYMLVTKVDIS
jgi:hypothetical protein